MKHSPYCLLVVSLQFTCPRTVLVYMLYIFMYCIWPFPCTQFTWTPPRECPPRPSPLQSRCRSPRPLRSRRYQASHLAAHQPAATQSHYQVREPPPAQCNAPLFGLPFSCCPFLAALLLAALCLAALFFAALFLFFLFDLANGNLMTSQMQDLCGSLCDACLRRQAATHRHTNNRATQNPYAPASDYPQASIPSPTTHSQPSYAQTFVPTPPLLPLWHPPAVMMPQQPAPRGPRMFMPSQPPPSMAMPGQVPQVRRTCGEATMRYSLCSLLSSSLISCISVPVPFLFLGGRG